MDLRLLWTPRHLNAEADALSNFKFAGFDPKLRIEVDIASLPFVFLGTLDSEARSWFLDDRPKALLKKDPDARANTKPSDRLRVKDPW